MGFDYAQQYATGGIIPFPGSSIPSFPTAPQYVSMDSSSYSSFVNSTDLNLEASVEIQYDSPNSDTNVLNEIELTCGAICDPCALWKFIEVLGDANFDVWNKKYNNLFIGTRYYYNKSSWLSMFLSLMLESIVSVIMLIGLFIYYLALGTAGTVIVIGFIVVNILTACIPLVIIGLYYLLRDKPEENQYEGMSTV